MYVKSAVDVIPLDSLRANKTTSKLFITNLSEIYLTFFNIFPVAIHQCIYCIFCNQAEQFVHVQHL